MPTERIRKMAEEIHELPFGNEALWEYLEEQFEQFKLRIEGDLTGLRDNEEDPFPCPDAVTECIKVVRRAR